ncbi:conserved hypothetical protein [Bosea sp. 62]|uniref:hypothetical protein n=1 Tax=unclassified Bosea (in: a-proteobacteria) TaxID=2653178 RepID=UPI00125C726F|nr:MULTISPECIES: hypothetical protein [unclassified Bosea (in: a-proteobacteria)]CAD5255898.1 conserved hypothetical protein [Bosea sp. 7B]CAD5274827.1 conserved hypothetical protein [Bosea sp. 21B]CAD5275987.1 conserved hypothetical protein [Bosea sp. 46]VVT60058.1 conserved hypothetical protein [Bosea sp. EC-HK365B]VXB53455.1 conserved hypothetical protein [Bosea sp. 62]
MRLAVFAACLSAVLTCIERACGLRPAGILAEPVRWIWWPIALVYVGVAVSVLLHGVE